MASEKRQLTLLEDLIKDSGYILRYEKGHFRAGYCIVNERRIIVVNKFFDTSARVQKLEELLTELEINKAELSEEHQEFLAKLVEKQQKASAKT